MNLYSTTRVLQIKVGYIYIVASKKSYRNNTIASFESKYIIITKI
nr:MAG TPA: hypothetical protein [Caudoviricetes sp.]